MSSKAKISSWDSPFKSHWAKKGGGKREEENFKSLVYNQLPLSDLASVQPWYSKGGGQTWRCLLLCCVRTALRCGHDVVVVIRVIILDRCGESVACTAVKIPDHLFNSMLLRICLLWKGLAWDGIFILLRSPGIDSKKLIPPAYVAWRAGTTTLFLLGS